MPLIFRAIQVPAMYALRQKLDMDGVKDAERQMPTLDNTFISSYARAFN